MAEHDSRAWETTSGWIWSCRTCLAKGFTDSESEAEKMRREHVARPVPWWVVAMEAMVRNGLAS